MGVDLNTEFKERLEPAFQQTDGMFDADADLEEIRSDRSLVMSILPLTSDS
jgi:hypothetical protein